MSKVVDGNEYLIVKEVAQLLRRSTTCVYRASDPDSPDPLPRIRIKRTLLYEVEDLRNWISRHKVESGDKLPGGDGNARDWRIRMSRKRYQAGFVRKRGKNVQTQYWEGTWREYVRGEAKRAFADDDTHAVGQLSRPASGPVGNDGQLIHLRQERRQRCAQQLSLVRAGNDEDA